MVDLLDTVSLFTIFATLAVLVGVVVVGILALTRSGDATAASGNPASNEVMPTTTTEPPPPEPFYVVGSTIVDPDRNEFIPVGVNAAVSAVRYPYVFEGGNGGVNSHLDAVQQWGWNTVRVNLACYNEAGIPTQDDIITGIDATIQDFTAAGVVMILACQDSTGQNPTLDSELETELRAFWDVVVQNYRDNPYVWFNFFNEPFDSDDPEAWSTLHQFYYDRYRSRGVENIMVFDLPIFGQAIDLAGTGEFADELAEACNTVLGWHAWGAIGGAEATLQTSAAALRSVLDKNHAVIIGEAGVPEPVDAGTAGNPAWNISGFYSAVEVAESTGVGMLWWHGTGDTVDELFYPLTADASGFWTAADGTNLSTAGERFREFSLRDRPVVAFDGDLADSGCPQADQG